MFFSILVQISNIFSSIRRFEDISRMIGWDRIFICFCMRNFWVLWEEIDLLENSNWLCFLWIILCFQEWSWYTCSEVEECHFCPSFLLYFQERSRDGSMHCYCMHLFLSFSRQSQFILHELYQNLLTILDSSRRDNFFDPWSSIFFSIWQVRFPPLFQNVRWESVYVPKLEIL